MYVRAQYIPQGLIPDPPGTPRPVMAVDEKNQQWFLREDSQEGAWLQFLANGGSIEVLLEPREVAVAPSPSEE
jgi:hypothetical protein